MPLCKSRPHQDTGCFQAAPPALRSLLCLPRGDCYSFIAIGWVCSWALCKENHTLWFWIWLFLLTIMLLSSPRYQYFISSPPKRYLRVVSSSWIVEKSTISYFYKSFHGSVSSFLLNVYQWWELLRHKGSICFKWMKLPACFPKWLFQLPLPPAALKRSSAQRDWHCQ